MANYPPRKQETEFPAISDFDPNSFVQAHSQHEKSISDLTDRLGKIEASLSTPQSLATFLEEAAKDSRQLEGVFAKMFCRFMAENGDVQQAVRKKVEDLDRNYFIKFFRRIGLGLYTLLVAALGAVGLRFLDWLMSLIPHK